MSPSREPPTWQLAPKVRPLRRCGSCGDRVLPETPYRTLRGGGVRCVPCAKRLLDEDPPTWLKPAPPPEPPAQAIALPLEPADPPDFKKRAGGD